MSGNHIAIGLMVGVILTGALIGVAGLDPEVDANTICENRFGPNWAGEQVDASWKNQSVTVRCTNGTAVERIGVDVSVEINS